MRQDHAKLFDRLRMDAEQQGRIMQRIDTSEALAPLRGKGVKDFPGLRYGSYYGTLDAIRRGEVRLLPTPRYDSELLRLVAERPAVMAHVRTMYAWPLCTVLLIVGWAWYFNNWWLLGCIACVPIALAVSSFHSKSGGALYLVSIGWGLYLGFTNVELLVVPLSFFFAFGSYSNARASYQRATTNAAMRTEQALLVLLLLHEVELWWVDPDHTDVARPMTLDETAY